MDPHTLPTPGQGATEAAGVLPVEQQPLIPNPNFVPLEAPLADEKHNLELPTVVPIDPVAAQQDAASAATANPLIPIPTSVPVTPSSGSAPSSQATANDLTADDRDIIEKAWITKAKAIVDQTRDNPYQQNKEINKIKADYIKKRYNKEVKLSEE